MAGRAIFNTLYRYKINIDFDSLLYWMGNMNSRLGTLYDVIIRCFPYLYLRFMNPDSSSTLTEDVKLVRGVARGIFNATAVREMYQDNGDLKDSISHEYNTPGLCADCSLSLVCLTDQKLSCLRCPSCGYVVLAGTKGLISASYSEYSADCVSDSCMTWCSQCGFVNLSKLPDIERRLRYLVNEFPIDGRSAQPLLRIINTSEDAYHPCTAIPHRYASVIDERIVKFIMNSREPRNFTYQDYDILGFLDDKIENVEYNALKYFNVAEQSPAY